MQRLLQTTVRPTKSKAEFYKVVKGDTLFSIAKLQLNDASRYREIAILNNITDTHSIYNHEILRLPK